MNKLKMQTMDGVKDNIRRIAELFPNCIVERKNANGDLEQAIDFDALRQELQDSIVEGNEERYQFTWPDKRKAKLLANAPINATLRPCREESVDFDTTKNLYIEGDNLDVLKCLKETYMGKVKMIYIDPPYNTGNDFVYEDDFAESAAEYLANSGQFDEQGNRLVTNAESNGRFHTDWLNMIYPRLRVAREFLTEDGVICIHIDDNEYENLSKLCNEIFGEDNFINIITIKTKVGGVSGSSEGKSLRGATEFILVYAKNKSNLLFNNVYIKTKLFDRIREYEASGKSWKYTSVVAQLGDKALLKEDSSKGMKFYGYGTLTTESIASFAKKNGITEEDVYNKYADKIFQTTNAQSSVRQTVIKETANYDYPMYGLEYTPIKGKNEGNVIEILYKGEQRRMMMFLSDAVEKIKDEYYYLDKLTTLWDDIDYNNLTKEGDIEFPNGKKPIKLLQRLIKLVCSEDSIVMDFFSGSASTAHATIQENIESQKNCKFIMIQLPEICDEKSTYANICEIGKERIRIVGKQIKEEAGLYASKLDTGFRVLKLDSTNMQDVYYSPADLKQSDLFAQADNIKPDRSGEDLLFQVMLELGILLDSKIEEQTIAGKKVFNVADNFLIACFDSEVTDEVIIAIAKKQPQYAVLRDSSYLNDSIATNFEQIFKTYSPNTTIKTL